MSPASFSYSWCFSITGLHSDLHTWQPEDCHPPVDLQPCLLPLPLKFFLQFHMVLSLTSFKSCSYATFLGRCSVSPHLKLQLLTPLYPCPTLFFHDIYNNEKQNPFPFSLFIQLSPLSHKIHKNRCLSDLLCSFLCPKHLVTTCHI